MALAPKYAGQKFTALTMPAMHTLELYLDYVCPFSAKMYKTIHTTVLPLVREQYANKLEVIFRQQIQPWHHSSTLVHEAGIAVLKLAPTKFWDFSTALFDDSRAYYDESVLNETRNKTYERLAKLGATVGVDEKKMYDLLKVAEDQEAPHKGNAVTNDVKVLVKMNRLVGIHVTPTVVFDGVVNNDVQSSFTGEQWKEWLEKNVV